jgi:ABC-type branched-subunit amino acid transport system ATPase component
MGALNLNANSFIYVFAIFSGLVALVMWAIMGRITRSPMDRTLRAIRDDPDVVRSLGKSPFRYQMTSLLVGSFYAGVGGGLIMYFVDAFNTSSWTTPETFVIFAAIIVGGLGSNVGAIAGALVVPVIFVELPKLLPQIGNNPTLLPEIDNMLIGALLIATLWFRPQGIVPEPRMTLARLAGGRGWALPRWRWPLPGGDRQRASLAAAAATAPAVTTPVTPETPGAIAASPLLRVRGGEGRRLTGDRNLAIEVDNLKKGFGGVQAVDGATFSVPEGMVCALIGPNGAGKSTAVNLISGAIRPEGGRVLLHGQDVTGWSADRVARGGLIRTFQLSREFGRLTVLENLLVTSVGGAGETLAGIFFRPGRVRTDEKAGRDRALAVLSTFGLSSLRDSYARELSGGQKRLLELARAVMARPRVLLLDEPMAGINPALIEQIGDHILALRHRGVTVLMVEHNLGVVERICDHVIVMAEGRTLATGLMSELRQHPEVVRAYLGGKLSASATG